RNDRRELTRHPERVVPSEARDLTLLSIHSDQPDLRPTERSPAVCAARDDGSLDQRLFRHCAQGELRDRPYVLAQERSSSAEIGRGLLIGDEKKPAIIPNN